MLAASEAARTAARTATEEAASISVHIKDAVDSAAAAKQAGEVALANAELSTAKAEIASTKAEESKTWADIAHEAADKASSDGGKNVPWIKETIEDILPSDADGMYYIGKPPVLPVGEELEFGHLPVADAYGCETRTLATRFSDIVNIKDFGAKGCMMIPRRGNSGRRLLKGEG